MRLALVADDLLDQFAFKPAGSTECAFINSIDFVTRTLGSNEYVRGRSQIAKISTTLLSKFLSHRGLVQGSGIGVAMYLLIEVICIPCLYKTSFFKFADDTNLVVPQHSDLSVVDEFINVQNWASNNKSIINYSKTREIVFLGRILQGSRCFLELA